MIPISPAKAGLCAALSLVIPGLLIVMLWARRISRRLRSLEAALRDDRQAIPQPIPDFDLDITLPRFIGSPQPPRRSS